MKVQKSIQTKSIYTYYRKSLRTKRGLRLATIFIQSINTSIGIFDKATGNLITAPTFNAFMSQGHFGNLCDTNNFGDPVVLYDTFEDRWIISAPSSFKGFANSTSSNPATCGGTWTSDPGTFPRKTCR